MDSLAAEWKPEQYHDTYAEELRKRIKAKDSGKDVVESEPEDEKKADVLDLMAALEASVDRAKSKRTGRSRKASGAKKATLGKARKSA